MAEVAGAVGNIVVNTQTITNPQIQQVVNIYNGAMGLIGVYHVGKGIVNFAKSLPDATQNLLRGNKSLKDIFTAQYIKWKEFTANLDNFTPAEKELIAKQEQVWRMLGVAENTERNRLIKNIDDFKSTIANGENVFYVGNHSDIIPRPTGVQSHHGINTVWMEATYSNYSVNNAPSVYMLNNPN